MDGNSSFAHSLSQSRMSVRNSSSLRAAPGSSRAEALVASVADAIAAQEVGGSASGGDLNDLQQELTEKAVIVIRRVMDKLTGLDFADSTGQQHALEVAEQVDRLIREATSNENLSQSFFGWCPFW
jgi:FKBP12-rapamycin complex-associated protein